MGRQGTQLPPVRRLACGPVHGPCGPEPHSTQRRLRRCPPNTAKDADTLPDAGTPSLSSGNQLARPQGELLRLAESYDGLRPTRRVRASRTVVGSPRHSCLRPRTRRHGDAADKSPLNQRRSSAARGLIRSSMSRTWEGVAWIRLPEFPDRSRTDPPSEATSSADQEYSLRHHHGPHREARRHPRHDRRLRGPPRPNTDAAMGGTCRASIAERMRSNGTPLQVGQSQDGGGCGMLRRLGVCRFALPRLGDVSEPTRFELKKHLCAP